MFSLVWKFHVAIVNNALTSSLFNYVFYLIYRYRFSHYVWKALFGEFKKYVFIHTQIKREGFTKAYLLCFYLKSLEHLLLLKIQSRSQGLFPGLGKRPWERGCWRWEITPLPPLPRSPIQRFYSLSMLLTSTNPSSEKFHSKDGKLCPNKFRGHNENKVLQKERSLQ